MRRLSRWLCFIFMTAPWGVLHAAVGTSATVPPLIKVSGTLAHAHGSVGVIFALYAEPTGGAPLWLETQNVTPDEKGRYTIYLGVNHASGVPLDLFASGEARWLGVQPEGQPEQARVELVSVPYALAAGDAQTLGGYPLSAFMLSSSVTGKAAASGGGTAMPNASANSVLELVTTTAGNTNFVSKFFDELGDVENSLLYDNGTYVGVGTTNPQAMLHVVAGSTPGMYVDVYGSTFSALPVVYRTAHGSPSSPSGMQANDFIGGMAGRGYYGTMSNGGWTSGRASIAFAANENWVSATNTSTYMDFRITPTGATNNNIAMRLTSTGWLGIGTLTPPSPLTVVGRIQSLSGTNIFGQTLTGGFVFPDNTVQTTAAVAGVALTSPDGSVTVGGSATAPTVAVNTAKIQAVVKQGTPASSSAACVPPQMMYDSSYIYTCVATNTWRRAASAAF